MPPEVFDQLKSVAIGAHKLRLSRSGVAPAPEKTTGKKITLSAPNKGGDRRVAEKGRNSKAPSKRVGTMGSRPAEAAKPKTHRKGTKPV